MVPQKKLIMGVFISISPVPAKGCIHECDIGGRKYVNHFHYNFCRTEIQGCFALKNLLRTICRRDIVARREYSLKEGG